MELALSGGELEEKESLDVFLDACEATGITKCEFWYPKNFSQAGATESETRKRLKDAGVQVICVATPTELVGKESPAENQDHIRRAISLAAELGSPYVVTYFGHMASRDDQFAIDTYVEALLPCLADAGSTGVKICLENECDYFGWDPAGSDVTRYADATVRLMEAVGSPHFGLTFDPANAFFAGSDPCEFYETVGRFVEYVHIKDGKRIDDPISVVDGFHAFADDGLNYSTCPFGEGSLPWTRLLGLFKERDYNGYLTLEPHCKPAVRLRQWRHASNSLKKLLQRKIG